MCCYLLPQPEEEGVVKWLIQSQMWGIAKSGFKPRQGWTILYIDWEIVTWLEILSGTNQTKLQTFNSKVTLDSLSQGWALAIWEQVLIDPPHSEVLTDGSCVGSTRGNTLCRVGLVTSVSMASDVQEILTLGPPKVGIQNILRLKSLCLMGQSWKTVWLGQLSPSREPRHTQRRKFMCLPSHSSLLNLVPYPHTPGQASFRVHFSHCHPRIACFSKCFLNINDIIMIKIFTTSICASLFPLIFL